MDALEIIGAGAFGVLIGWYVYYINRYRGDAVQFSDLVTLIGIIGGGGVLALFDKNTDQFGAYGIGLCVGFFGYFVFLIIFVTISRQDFNFEWFLDGRRKDPEPGWGYAPNARQTGSAMDNASRVAAAQARVTAAQADLDAIKESTGLGG